MLSITNFMLYLVWLNRNCVNIKLIDNFIKIRNLHCKYKLLMSPKRQSNTHLKFCVVVVIDTRINKVQLIQLIKGGESGTMDQYGYSLCFLHRLMQRYLRVILHYYIYRLDLGLY